MKKDILLGATKRSPFQSDDELEIGDLQIGSKKRDFLDFLDENVNEQPEYDQCSSKKSKNPQRNL